MPTVHPGLDAYFRQFPLVSVPKGFVFIRENQQFVLMRYIETGYVRHFINTPQGSELTLALFRPRMYFPSALMFCGTQYSRYSTVAMTHVTYREVPIPDFLEHLNTHTDLLWEAARYVAIMAHESSAHLELLVTTNGYNRVVAKLVSLADRLGAGQERGQVVIPMSHQTLSTFVALTRETVSRYVGVLSRKGIIRCGNQRITILDRRALEHELTASESELVLDEPSVQPRQQVRPGMTVRRGSAV